jgi:hypothetical protein
LDHCHSEINEFGFSLSLGCLIIPLISKAITVFVKTAACFFYVVITNAKSVKAFSSLKSAFTSWYYVINIKSGNCCLSGLIRTLVGSKWCSGFKSRSTAVAPASSWGFAAFTLGIGALTSSSCLASCWIKLHCLNLYFVVM